MINYPTYQGYMPRPQPYAAEPNYPVIKGRPVSSFEEARASMIDFDGSVFYFPDLANHKIYTKQINLDGTPSLKVYELVAQPTTASTSLVTKAEFEQTVNNLLQQIDALKTQSAPTESKNEEFKF